MSNGKQRMNPEQRINMNFFTPVGENSVWQVLEIISASIWRYHHIAHMYFEWHKKFKERHKESKDDSGSNRPSTSRTEVNVEQVRQVACSDDLMTVQMIASQLNMKKDSVWKIITEDLRMRYVCAELVPRLANDDQNECRTLMCQDITDHLQTEKDLLHRFITREKWTFEYDTETNRQISQWKSSRSPRPKRTRHTKAQVKVILITFFDVLYSQAIN